MLFYFSSIKRQYICNAIVTSESSHCRWKCSVAMNSLFVCIYVSTYVYMYSRTLEFSLFAAWIIVKGHQQQQRGNFYFTINIYIFFFRPIISFLFCYSHTLTFFFFSFNWSVIQWRIVVNFVGCQHATLAFNCDAKRAENSIYNVYLFADKFNGSRGIDVCRENDVWVGWSITD